MRFPLIAAAMLAASLPSQALAQDAEASPLEGAAEMMSNPETQAQAGLMAAMLVSALMEMPVGQIAEAANAAAGEDGPAIDPDARVRDLLGPEAENAPELVAERLPQMMEAMAGMAETFETVLPQLRDMAERLPRE